MGCVLIQGVECGFVNVPLHNIYLSSDLVTGLVAVSIRPSLPFKGVHLLLGNDLAWGKVVVNPLLTIISCIDQPPDPTEQEIPDLYLSCAVTRAMAKKAKQNDGDIDLTNTFLGQPFKPEITNSLSSSLSDKQTDLSDNSVLSLLFNIKWPRSMSWLVQGHNFIRNSIMILKFCLCLKGLLMRKKQIKSQCISMSLLFNIKWPRSMSWLV